MFHIVGLVISGLDEHGSLGREVIEGQLANHFQDAFTLDPADAAVAAREAVACWDEAGIFVDASDGLITPRLRLFAEVGAAMHAHDLANEALQEWVAKASADENRTETLRLAAGLDSRIAELLCEQACRDFGASGSQRLLFVVAQAAAEGAALIPDRWERLRNGYWSYCQTKRQLGKRRYRSPDYGYLCTSGMECARYLSSGFPSAIFLP